MCGMTLLQVLLLRREILFAGNDKWLQNISKFKGSLKQYTPCAVPFRQRKPWINIWVVDLTEAVQMCYKLTDFNTNFSAYVVVCCFLFFLGYM